MIGDFNDWDGRAHPMRRHVDKGIWELFLPDVFEGLYRFEIVNARTGELLVKSDPYARSSEYRPDTDTRDQAAAAMRTGAHAAERAGHEADGSRPTGEVPEPRYED